MSRAWKQLLTIPGVGVSLLPKIACPLCWPSYAGLLGSLGLGFLILGKYLLPLTGAFLVLTVGALAFGAKRRHGYGPLGLGIVASGGVLLGKFAWESTLAIYATVGLLVIASAWNASPRQNQACRPELYNAESRKLVTMARLVDILLVDDFAPWRDQLRSVLSTRPQWNIVGEACDGKEAIEKASEMQHDIILLDIGMPSLNGIEAAKIIYQRCPKSKILFLTQETDSDVRDAAMRAGAAGYLLKTNTGNELLGAIAAAISNS